MLREGWPLSQVLASELWRASPAECAARWSSGVWRYAKHLDLLASEMAQIHSGPVRLIVTLPPRHGKSELASHWAPAWYLANWPSRRVILSSYEATFAASWGRKVRNTLVASPGLGVRIASDSAAVSAWETDAGGGMQTAGVGGPILGKGADLFILDDPYKNAEEAGSPVIRENIWQWWQTTALTRLEPGASVIIVMSRWDTDDLVGRLIGSEGARWRLVTLPAKAEERDVLGREVGAPLWPERYPGPALSQIERDVGPDAWASLYQQRPNPQGRGLFFDVAACHTLLQGCREPVQTRLGGAVSIWKPRIVGARYVAGGDCAWGEKGAYSVVSILDFQTGEQVAELYGRLSLDETAQEAVKLCREYNDAYCGIERNGEGAKVADTMVRLGYGGRMYWHDREKPKPVQPGWLTSAASRPVMLADLEEAVRTLALRPACAEGCRELLSFVRDEHGKPGPRPGTYSDHVFAWAIAWQMREFMPAGKRVADVTYGVRGR